MNLSSVVDNILQENNITPGSKEYFKMDMSDDEILNLANGLIKYPYSKAKKPPEIQRFFRDVANLLGFPNEPIDVMTYDTLGVGRLDKNKIKMKPKLAPLFQMYKDKKLDMKQYREIQKPLMVKYIQLAKTFIKLLMWSKGIK